MLLMCNEKDFAKWSENSMNCVDIQLQHHYPSVVSTFGQQIRDRRKELGLTQRDLAKLVKMDFTYLSKIENAITDDNGRPYIPSQEKIMLLAKALKLDAEELLAQAGKVSPSLHAFTKGRGFQEFYRTAKSSNLSEEDWHELLQVLKQKKAKE
jgi:transcriptional regulator with XRE-family HTH domain